MVCHLEEGVGAEQNETFETLFESGTYEDKRARQ